MVIATIRKDFPELLEVKTSTEITSKLQEEKRREYEKKQKQLQEEMEGLAETGEAAFIGGLYVYSLLDTQEFRYYESFTWESLF